MSDTNERSVASTGSRCVDICDRLRIAPAKLIGTVDEDTYWACHEAADKIDRMRLTDEEREAIEEAIRLGSEWGWSDTLRRLLERLGTERQRSAAPYAALRGSVSVKETTMRHSFRVMEELGAECDRLGIRVVDVHGESGSASDFLAKVARYIEAREMELHDRRWIPVTERLPEAGQTVMLWNYVDHRLGWLKYTANGVAYFFSTQDECNIEPTHWMPLPAPPTDGK